MVKILLIDDDPVIRNPLATILRSHGHQAVCVGDALTASLAVREHRPDVVLLDVCMPGKDGLQVLREIRDDPLTTEIPVLLLTAKRDKELVLKAAKLGVQGFILKTSLSIPDLLARVSHYAIAAPEPDVADACPVTPAHATPAPRHFPSAAPVDVVSAPKYAAPQAPLIVPKLAREESLARVEKSLSGRSLPGVITQVISAASSPNCSLGELASPISRDPVLSARILHVANSPACMTSGKTILSIHEAVRQIGCSRVRDLAAATGVFDLFPLRPDPINNPLRCWQHSLAVAEICQHLALSANPSLSGLAYLVGLCHDLGEIVLSTCFYDEVVHILQIHARTGRPRADVEREILGVSHVELVDILLRHLELPSAIRNPIAAFHHQTAKGAAELHDPLARLLRLADVYANGMLLASDASASVFPISAAEMRRSMIREPLPPAASLTAQTAVLTCSLARVSYDQITRMLPPLFPLREGSICVTRHSSFSTWDPVLAALSSISRQVTCLPHLPSPGDCPEASLLVVITPSTNLPGMDAAALSACVRGLPNAPAVLWLASHVEDYVRSADLPNPMPLPLSLHQLASYLSPVAVVS